MQVQQQELPAFSSNLNQEKPLEVVNQSKDQEMYQETEVNPDGFFADLNSSSDQAQSVRVALRVRPLLPRENLENAKVIVDVIPKENQVLIGPEQRCFTFDKAFDQHQSQQEVFESCVKNLVLGCFAGFNATVLAYGQTGSGKTYTMGSGFVNGIPQDDLGIIPRVISLIFEEEAKRRSKAEFLIKCSFLEIYNEELIDLLDQNQQMGDRAPQKKDISIREEKNGTISVYGLTEVKVTTAEQMAEQLDTGSHARRTASTLMNQQSSRSHGIFTVTIEQHLIEDLGEQELSKPAKDEFTVAKFHFVDLAGSERTKKTGAEGKTLKEGININKSLLALGQVISALTDQERKGHIPYRDSKLTRILQDSLGGNSRTSMIACCSPAETSYDETLNTLKYAARARNIQNKPVVNRDPATQQILSLRQQVYELQKEMVNWRKIMNKNGIEVESKLELPPESSFVSEEKISRQSGQQPISSSSGDTQALESMIADLRKQVQFKDSELRHLQERNNDLKSQVSQQSLSNLLNQKQRDEALLQCQQLQTQLTQAGLSAKPDTDTVNVLEEYRQKVFDLESETQILKSEVKSLQQTNFALLRQNEQDTQSLENYLQQIEKLKLQNEQLKAAQLQSKVPKSATKPKRMSSFADNGWISSDLEHKLKNLDDIRQRFVQNLGEQMNQILGGESLNNEQQEDEPMHTDSEQDGAQSEEDENGASQDEQDMLQPCLSNQQLQADEQALNNQEQTLKTLDSKLNEKEQILSQFKQAQQELQDSLLQEMKQQYHQRVEALQQELLRLEQTRNQEVSKTTSAQTKQKLEQAYSLKQQELQQQLQLMAKKDLETRQMKKKLDSYQQQVGRLDTELRQMKTQKVQLQKKVKEDSDRLAKQRAEQQKELIKLRQQILKQDREKQNLKQEAHKQQLQAKRKQEELLSLQKRQKQENQKRQNATQMKQNLRSVDKDQLQTFILTEIDKMLQFNLISDQRISKQRDFQQLEEEIGQLLQQNAQFSLQQERIEQKLGVQGANYTELSEQKSQLKQQQEDIRSQIETLGSKQRFINAQIIELVHQTEQLKPAQLSSVIKNLEGAKAMLQVYFDLLLDAHLGIQKMSRDLDFKAQEIDMIEKKIEDQRLVTAQEKKKILREFNQAVLQQRKKQKVWFDLIIQKTGFDASQLDIPDGDISRLLELCFTSQQKQLMHLGSDNLGIGKQALQQIGRSIDSQTRIAQVSQQPKPSLADARNARRAQKQKEESEEPKIQTKRPITAQKEQNQGEDKPVQWGSADESQMWNLHVVKPDAHRTAVTAIASFEKNIVSAANKSLKIWDIDTMTSVSELQDFGLVRQIVISKLHQLLIIAAEKQIIMWDMVNLAKVASYTGANEIKCLQLNEEKGILCAGTRGTTTSGALLLFDIRKRPAKPYDQKEYNQDVSALTTTKDNLYLSNRNVVAPFSYESWQTLQQYPGGHTDAVTGLLAMPDVLVSGGRDKCLKTYSYKTPEIVGSLANAHNEQITCLASSESQQTFFSGARDGTVKEWNTSLQQKFEFPNQHTQINAICALSSQFYQKSIAVAQADKSIKIWRENPNYKAPLMLDLSQHSQTSALSALKQHKNSKKQKNQAV